MMLRSLTTRFPRYLHRTLATASKPKFTTVIGIDLGTTNSAVAVMQGDEPRIIENDEGARTTPSIVAFARDGSIIVGAAAKRQALLNTENTFYATKRLIGRKFDDEEIKYDMDHVPYKIVEAENGDAWLESFGKRYSPPQISGMILNKMKEIAEMGLSEPVKNTVVTVPAYFNDAQRQATKDAGKIVGLNVLRVINEPTAAALAYGLDKKNDGMVAVYDLGGGTFDISILDIEDGVFEVCATNGDTHLGGEDFDILIVKYILEKLHRETGIDLSHDRERIQRIREAAEKAKIALSHVKETTIDLPFIIGTHHISFKMTEDELDAMSQHLIDRTIPPIKQALKDAGLTKNDIDEVVLVGGMTRMPKIRSTVQEVLDKKPITTINPDEAVALGAAIQGGVLSGAIKDVLLLDVAPLSLGIEVHGGIFSPIIPRNSVVPIKKTEVFSTGVDNQTGIEVRVYQGERSFVDANKLIGNFKLSGIPPLPKGVPQVQVTFDIDADGIMNVSAKEKTSGKETSITIINNTGLTEDEINKMVKEGEENKEQDIIKKNKLEGARNTEMVLNDTEMAISAFQEVIKNDKDYELLAQKISEVKKGIQIARDNGDITVPILRDLSKALQDISVPILQRAALLKQKQSQK